MRLEEVAPGDPRLINCHQAYFAEISERFGVVFDPGAGDPERSEIARQWDLILLDGDRPVGCGSLRDLGSGIAEVKRVWISREVRGRGAASIIMDRLEARAEAERFSAIRLDTNRTLTEAKALYQKRGYREIERYNENPFADHFLEKKTPCAQTGVSLPETS